MQLEKIVQATRRPKRRFKGKDRIALRVGKVLNRYKVGKHFVLDIGEESFSYQRQQERIEQEAALDGIYVIRTNLAPEQMNAEQTVAAYKGLSVAERAFRSCKSVDLKVRPIYHHLENRVRAHVFLCMLAYYVEWQHATEVSSDSVRRRGSRGGETASRFGGGAFAALCCSSA